MLEAELFCKSAAKMSESMLKRVLDIVIASSALVLLSPVYALVAYKVRKNLGSPVLFRQVRSGLAGKPFEMIKFRSMKDAVDAQGNPLPDGERLTPFGQMLRSAVWMKCQNCGTSLKAR